ncbi:MAG: hypothetical protein BIFFINMI_03814 [Phycisphaerae bacterium]|nr:hypothetical protein [Phycisphaerae bacterium]
MAEQIRVDPEFEKLIPPMTPAERAGLEENLLADGCREPLVVWHERPACPCGGVPLRGKRPSPFTCSKCGKAFAVVPIVLDGHNRLRICTEHSIPYEAVEAEDVQDRDAAKAWIIRNQIGRRNLTESQRAMLATALEEIFGKQAKERQAESARRNQPQAQNVANLPHSENPSRKREEPATGPTQQMNVRAREQAAAEMNVSPRLVQAAKKVTQAGTPALQDAVRKGEVSVSAAADLTELPRDEQDRVAADGGKAAARAARTVRQSRHLPSGPGGVSPRAMRPVRGPGKPQYKTALELPHDPVHAARTLISVFGRQFIVDLVAQLNLLLEGDAS